MTNQERRYYQMGYKKACMERRRRYGAANPVHPRDERKARLAERYGLSQKQLERITQKLLDQLERCKDEAARRLLLGIGDAA